MTIKDCLYLIMISSISLLLYKPLLFDKNAQSYCLDTFYEIEVKLDTDLKKSIKMICPDRDLNPGNRIRNPT